MKTMNKGGGSTNAIQACRLAVVALVGLSLCGCGTLPTGTGKALLGAIPGIVEDRAGAPMPEVDFSQITDKSYRENTIDRFEAWWELTPWADKEEPAGSVVFLDGPNTPIGDPPAGATLQMLWKQESESTGNPVLIWHTSLREMTGVTVNGRSEGGAKSGGHKSDFYNGDRWHVWIDSDKSSYPKDTVIRARTASGHLTEWVVPNPLVRNENVRGEWVYEQGPEYVASVLYTTDKQGFFSVVEHAGDVYGGEYSNRGRVIGGGSHYDLNPGESVYRMLSVGDDIWSTTENKGILFRGRQEILRAGKWGFGLLEHKGSVVSTHSNPETQIYLTRIADNHVVRASVPGGGNRTARSLCELDGVLYAPGFDYGTEEGGWFRSTDDGLTWKWIAVIKGVRFMDSAKYDGRMWLAASPYVSGKRVHPAGVYSTEGAGVREELRTKDTRVGMCITTHGDGLLFGTLNNWRATSGNGELWEYNGGQWGMLWKAPEPELTKIVSTSEGIVLSTRRDNGNGKVYLLR